MTTKRSPQKPTNTWLGVKVGDGPLIRDCRFITNNHPSQRERLEYNIAIYMTAELRGKARIVAIPRDIAETLIRDTQALERGRSA